MKYFIKYKIIFILLIINFSFLINIFSHAQGWKRYRKELSIGIGASNFLGDLGGANTIGTHGILDFDFPSIRPVGNIGFTYKLSQRFSVKTCFTYGEVYGNDSYTEEKYRNHRNLMFRSSITQLHAQLELYIIREKEGHKYYIQGVKGWRNIKISSYLFIGVAGYYFNPKAKYTGPTTYSFNGKSYDMSSYEGNWYSLDALHTEGEGVYPTRPMYSHYQVAIPVGIGLKYSLRKDLSIGLEYALYKTWTDYVDDVSTTYPDYNYLLKHYGILSVWFSNPHKADWGGMSWATTAPGQQRGDARAKDSYMFAFITLYYTIPTGRFVIPLF